MSGEYSDEIIDHFNQVKPVKEPVEPRKSNVKPFIYAAVAVVLIFLVVGIVPDKETSENGVETPQPILIQEPAKVQINIAADPDVTTHIEFIPDTGNEIIEIKPENEEPTVMLTPPKPEKPRIVQSEPKKPTPVRVTITQTRNKPVTEQEKPAPKPPPEVSYELHLFSIGCAPKRSPAPYQG